MRRLVAGVCLVVSGCAATPLERLLTRARQNEVAAVGESTDARVSLEGVVRELSFERASTSALETTTVTRPLAGEIGVQRTAQTREARTTVETPYAEVDAAGTPVRCYFERTSDAVALEVGARARLTGTFRALRRLEGDGFRLWLEACAVAR